ncbi:TonB-dependent receptor domain-containing protein [Sphingomicrobium astaxanthinifaciens]|nr:TonB-dependent receptor [Sphingomicrobium astaxanthinifaciens]MCJ7422293.1 TonB-dependent receptor [Sphingomicrobium astaxanthinifaciens]
MKRKQLYNGSALFVLAGGLAFPQLAHAQDSGTARAVIQQEAEEVADPEVEEEDVLMEADGSDVEGETIVITGSRIRLPEVESRLPIITVDEEYIENRNLTNVADALNELPVYRGSVTPAGGQGSFGQGVNFLNAFALGSNRNLTLINGRRFVTSNPPTVFNNSGAGTQVDLNVVPTVLIDRVESIAVGGAPVYGSDAIASTTNVILKTRFDDVVISGTSGITEYGDNFRYNVSAVAGQNFFDDRLNITASVSHDVVEGVLQNERPFLTTNILTLRNIVADGGVADQNRVNPTFTNDNLGGVDNPDGNPPFVQFYNGNLPYLSRGGVIFGGPLSLGAQFDQNGDIVPLNLGEFPAGSFFAVGGDGFQFSDFSQITSDLERTSGNLFVTAEVADDIEVYAEGTYFFSRADELVQQPSFNTILFGGASGSPLFFANNPFLTDQARQTLAAAGQGSFLLSRVNLDLSDPSGFGENEIYRGVLGVRGEFEGLGRVFNFDVSYNRGDATVTTFSEDINQQNFINAINVTTDANGNIVCDPTPPVSATVTAGGGSPNGDPNCVPLNLFGEGNASQAALDYVIQDNEAVATLDQEVFNANIGSTLFDIWGAGPIGWNLGYERRTEQGKFLPSEFQQQGLGRSVAIEPVEGEFTIDEFFGEAIVPLVSPDNDFLIHSAELNGGIRFVENTVNGAFTSWTAGGRFAPVRDIEFRGNFTRSFRAPAISELFSPQGNAFGTVPQPCENPDAGPNPAARQRNCAAFLAAFPNANDDPSSNATIPILTGGNPSLLNEEADAWTVGAVIQPRFIPRLVLALDYVNFDISQPITTLSIGQIVSACFDNENFNTADPANGNAFCSLIRRQPAGTQGTLPDGSTGDIGGFVVNDPNNPGVTTTFVNGESTKFEGLQGVASWDQPNLFGGPGTFALSGNFLWTLFRENDVTGVSATRTDATFGDPEFAAQLNTRYYTDTWGVLVSTNFVGKQVATREELGIELREINTIDPYATFNSSVYFDPTENFRFTLSVTNMFDRNYANDYFGSGIQLIDSLGRRYAASARLRF